MEKATPHPKGGDGRGVVVRLELPWTTLAQDEEIAFRFVLENASNESIPIAVPRSEWGLAVPVGGQAFLSGGWVNGSKSPIQGSLFGRTFVVDQAHWPPKHPEGYEMEAWTELPATQRLVWDQSRIDALFFDIIATVHLETLQGHWLVGPGRWVSSELVPVKVLPIPRSEWKQVFSATWSSYGFGKDRRSGTCYTVPIAGKLFLFLGRYRVTEVGSEDRYEYEIDKDCTNMEITIAGPAETRKVYHHLRHGITRDTPWPIGPVSLLAPKPEPIPPAELEVLRKKMAEAKDNNGTGRSISSPATPNPKGGPQTLDSRNKVTVFWPWIAGGVALLIAFSASMVIRAKRNISISGQ